MLISMNHTQSIHTMNCSSIAFCIIDVYIYSSLAFGESSSKQDENVVQSERANVDLVFTTLPLISATPCISTRPFQLASSSNDYCNDYLSLLQGL
jgi:hypothetical protein